jgi:hypothetical protein
LTVNRSFKNAKPDGKENTVPLFVAFYKDRFDRIAKEADPIERDRLIREVRKLAKKARISIPRKMFER